LYRFRDIAFDRPKIAILAVAAISVGDWGGTFRSSAVSARIEAPKARRRVGSGEGVSPSPAGEGSGRGLCPLPRNFFDF